MFQLGYTDKTRLFRNVSLSSRVEQGLAKSPWTESVSPPLVGSVLLEHSLARRGGTLILTLGRWRQEDQEFESILMLDESPSQGNKHTEKKQEKRTQPGLFGRVLFVAAVVAASSNGVTELVTYKG